MNTIEKIASGVRRHGLHKIASRVLIADGLPTPREWRLDEVAFTLGTKVAMDRIAHQSIMAGLGSLYELAGELGEKTASDGLYHEFSRVKILADRAGKVASEALRDDIGATKVGFWQRCKRAAANEPGGVLIGLAKIAVSFFAETAASGEKCAASEDEVVEFAASFACASVVDNAIENMIKSAEVTPTEGLFLARLNAQAAFNDLAIITR